MSGRYGGRMQLKFASGATRGQVAKYIKKMASVRKFNRGSKPKRVDGGVKRGAYGSSRPVKLGSVLGSNQIFPELGEIDLCTTMQFYIPAGSATAAAGNYFAIRTNSIVQPFNPATYAITTGTGTATFACNGTLLQGYSISNGPLGSTTLSSLYGKYLVMGYKIEITVNPGQTSDVTRLVIFPSGSEEIPSGAAGNVNDRVLESQPYALAKTCSSGTIGGPGRDNTLVLSGCPYKDLGLTREQYMANGSAIISAAPTVLDYVGVFLQQLNGSNNGAAMAVEVKLLQTCRLMDATELLN